MKNFLWSLLLVICVAALAWWWPSRPEEVAEQSSRPPVPVRAVVVATRDFQDEASALGTLRAWESGGVLVVLGYL